MSSITSLIGVNPLQFEAPTQTVLSTRVHSGNGDSVWDINPFQLGVGVLGVAGSNTVAGLAKRWALNGIGLRAGALRVLASTTTDAALKAMPLTPIQKAALFMVSATTFHAAHRLYGYTVEGHAWQGAALEAEGYLSTLAMFAVMAGVMGAAAKYAPVLVATKPAAFATEYAAFSAYEPLEAGVRSVIHGGSFRDTAAHSFTAKAFVERFAFLGALKAAHPVTARIENHVGHKLSTAQLARSIQNQPVRFASYAAATGGLLATAMGHAEGVMAAAAVVPTGETARVYDPTKPGGFLFENAAEAYRNCHVPELLDSELQVYVDWAKSLPPEVARHVGLTDLRNLVEIDHKAGTKDFTKMRKLFQFLGEQGYFALDLPSDLSTAFFESGVSPMGLDSKTLVRIYEAMASHPGSIRATQDSVGCNVGIGMNPILLFGNNAQRTKYLPGILSGRLVSAFALTEPNSGSDAPGGIRTTAVLDGDHYVINGSKQFITNGGYADVFIVFAKTNGKPSAFIVDRRTDAGADTPGLIIGKEEHKMGLDASSCVPLTFENMRVPAENLIFMEGQGMNVALGTLAFGRSKLAAAFTGGCVQAVNYALDYARTRTSGRNPITNYGEIQTLLADAAIDTFVAQSIVSRQAGDTDVRLEAAKSDPVKLAQMQALEQMQGTNQGLTAKVLVGQDTADLASMAKLFVSEAAQRVAHKAAQVFGGYGFIEEYPIATLQRDVRVGTMYEGTSQIQKVMIIAPWILNKGEMSRPAHELKDSAVQTDLAGRRRYAEKVLGSDHALINTVTLAEQAKMLSSWAFGAALAEPGIREVITQKTHPEFNGRGQQINARLADMATTAYAIDSAVQRALRLHEAAKAEGEPNKYQLQADMATAYAATALESMRAEAKALINNVFAGSGNYGNASRVVNFLTGDHYVEGINADGLKANIAQALLARQGGYDL